MFSFVTMGGECRRGEWNEEGRGGEKTVVQEEVGFRTLCEGLGSFSDLSLSNNACLSKYVLCAEHSPPRQFSFAVPFSRSLFSHPLCPSRLFHLYFHAIDTLMILFKISEPQRRESI